KKGSPHKNSNKRKKYNGELHAQDGRNNKKKKGSCFFCKKVGHYKKECRFYKKMQEKSFSSKDNLVTVISEINMVEDDESWWVDSGATRHVCKNKDLLKTLKEEDENVLYMRNASSVQVNGKGTVEIEFTSGK
ncbi:RNA-directed DNA polymerase protein, partial [Dioscorea alata]